MPNNITFSYGTKSPWDIFNIGIKKQAKEYVDDIFNTYGNVNNSCDQDNIKSISYENISNIDTKKDTKLSLFDINEDGKIDKVEFDRYSDGESIITSDKLTGKLIQFDEKDGNLDGTIYKSNVIDSVYPENKDFFTKINSSNLFENLSNKIIPGSFAEASDREKFISVIDEISKRYNFDTTAPRVQMMTKDGLKMVNPMEYIIEREVLYGEWKESVNYKQSKLFGAKYINAKKMPDGEDAGRSEGYFSMKPVFATPYIISKIKDKDLQNKLFNLYDPKTQMIEPKAWAEMANNDKNSLEVMAAFIDAWLPKVHAYAEKHSLPKDEEYKLLEKLYSGDYSDIDSDIPEDDPIRRKNQGQVYKDLFKILGGPIIGT